MNSTEAPIFGHMAAVSDPIRCRVLLLLETHELTVSELCAVLQMPQSSVSRHLKVLADEAWVASRRDGTSRFYSLAADALDETGRQLWPIIREQVLPTKVAAEDRRRFRTVIAKRRATSQAFFATAAGQWDRLREELFGDVFHLRAVLGLIEPTLVVGDLGCGTGLLSSTVAPYVRRVIAVDGSTEMLEAARSRLEVVSNVTIRQGEMDALPLEAGELDIAMLSLVLHYVPDPVRGLAEVARVVRPGGRILIADMFPHDREEYQQRMGHVWLGFSAAHIERLLTGAGFGGVTVSPLPMDPEAKGPALFAAIGTRR